MQICRLAYVAILLYLTRPLQWICYQFSLGMRWSIIGWNKTLTRNKFHVLGFAQVR